MTSPLPQHLQEEQCALEAEIREAFKGVTREGGVSWSETFVLDGYGSKEACDAARAQDTDKDWTDLAYDSNWDAGPGNGGWCFLDWVGARYYLPAAMIRALHAGDQAFSVLTLGDLMDGVLAPDRAQMNLLEHRQRLCVARFVRFMAVRAGALDDQWGVEEWQQAYECWKAVKQS